MEESLDTLLDGKLWLYQSRSGYRFSLDALLLAHFVEPKLNDSIIDLGAGSGVVSLLLADRLPEAKLTAVEIQPGLAARARRNIAKNRLGRRVVVVEGDVRRIGSLFPQGQFGYAVCNPPYRRARSGRLSVNEEKQIARHEILAKLDDFIRAAVYLLAPKGKLAFVYPAVRAVDLLTAMRAQQIEPKRIRWVHSFAADEACLLLVEGVNGGRAGVKVEPPLVLYQRAGQYSPEVAGIIMGKAQKV